MRFREVADERHAVNCHTINEASPAFPQTVPRFSMSGTGSTATIADRTPFHGDSVAVTVPKSETIHSGAYWTVLSATKHQGGIRRLKARRHEASFEPSPTGRRFGLLMPPDPHRRGEFHATPVANIR